MTMNGKGYVTESFTVTIGVTPGYDHQVIASYAPMSPESMALLWDRIVGLPAVIQPALVSYPTGPSQGEPIMVITGVRNPFYQEDERAFHDKLYAGVAALAEHLEQFTVQIVHHEMVAFTYMRALPFDGSHPIPEQR